MERGRARGACAEPAPVTEHPHESRRPRPKPRVRLRATSRRCSSPPRGFTGSRRRREPRTSPSIRVVGVGGAGLNALHRMIDAGIAQVDFVAVNTDMQALAVSDAPTKIAIGEEVTHGLGSGADPSRRARVGRGRGRPAPGGAPRLGHGLRHRRARAAEPEPERRPVVARVARELGALTVGIVTTPFRFEGTRRRNAAERGVEELRAACDTVIVIPNDRLLEVLDRSTSMVDAFKIADDVLRQGVQGIMRSDHDAGADQPRLRRRAHGDAGRRLRADGNRLRDRAEPCARGGRARARLAAHRRRDRERPGHPALDRGRRRPLARSRSTRPPRSCARRRPTRRTSSSARPSTRG